VVQIELRARHPLATVLTGIRIARVDVYTAEAHVPLGHPVESCQENDARHSRPPTIPVASSPTRTLSPRQESKSKVWYCSFTAFAMP
jgi:hypothetical protein